MAKRLYLKEGMYFLVARIIAIILLFLALGKLPYSYYTILRFVVCGVTGYGAFYATNLKKNTWVWSFGIVAILFNPLFPIHLSRDVWAVIDISVGVLLIASFFKLEEKTKSDKKE